MVDPAVSGRHPFIPPALIGVPPTIGVFERINNSGAVENNRLIQLPAGVVAERDTALFIQAHRSASPADAPSNGGTRLGYLVRSSATAGEAATLAIFAKVIKEADLTAGAGGVPAITIPQLHTYCSVAGIVMRDVGLIDLSLDPESASEGATSGFSRSAGQDANTIAPVSMTPTARRARAFCFLGHGVGRRNITNLNGWTLAIDSFSGTAAIDRYSCAILSKMAPVGLPTGDGVITYAGAADMRLHAINALVYSK